MMKTTRAFPLFAAAMLTLAGPSFAASYNKDYVGKMETYRANYEDTLVHLARANNLGFVEMRAANPSLDPWIPGDGARVVLPTQYLLPDAPREGIVINLPEMRLYYFPTPGAMPITYPISPGREGLRTPLGTTTVTHKKKDPTWTPTPRMIKEDPTLKPFYPAGPDNPLGEYALYLGFPEIRIHGTNKPYAIGRLASSGCIRMYPESIRELYPRIADGTKVTVVDQPVKVGWIENKMYVEVSPTQQQSTQVDSMADWKSYEITAEDMKRITAKAGPAADRIDWEAVRKAVREHRGYPVAVLDRGAAKGAHVVDETEVMLQKDADEDRLVKEANKATEAKPQVKERSKDAVVVTETAPSAAPARTVTVNQ